MAPRILMLHKPKAVVVTRRDERGRRTVYDLLPAWALAEGWVPAGRLDRDSRGLLLLVREGALADRLTRPGGFTKAYEVLVRGCFTRGHAAACLAGLPTPVGLLRAASVAILGRAGPRTRLRLELCEGRNRHIRRMCGALRDPETGAPLKVLDLKRVAVGPLALDIPSGRWRFVAEAELGL